MPSVPFEDRGATAFQGGCQVPPSSPMRRAMESRIRLSSHAVCNSIRTRFLASIIGRHIDCGVHRAERLAAAADGHLVA